MSILQIANYRKAGETVLPSSDIEPEINNNQKSSIRLSQDEIMLLVHLIGYWLDEFESDDKEYQKKQVAMGLKLQDRLCKRFK